MRVLKLACYANALLAQGYSPQDAERLALAREEDAIVYADRQFRAAWGGCMHFTVYTFNDGYPLYLFLNGLRSYFGSPEWSGLVFLMVSGLTLAGILMVRQISPLGYFKAYAGPLLLYGLFFRQTAQICIQDEWAHEAYTIDTMPVGGVIPLSVCSTVEKVILDMVETHIMPPDMTSFSDFDFFMEAAALGEVLNGKAISQFEALSSVGRYFNDCVLKGIATGFVNESAYYRSEDLLTESYMPWGIHFTELINKDGTREVMTCKATYNRLWGTVKDEAQSVGPAGMADYLSSLFGGRHKNVADTIMAMDSLASTLFPGHQSTSEALFQQAFMMIGLQSSLARSNPQMLSAISQAEVSQATGIAAASSVYIKKAPKLRAMMKMVITGIRGLRFVLALENVEEGFSGRFKARGHGREPLKELSNHLVAGVVKSGPLCGRFQIAIGEAHDGQRIEAGILLFMGILHDPRRGVSAGVHGQRQMHDFQSGNFVQTFQQKCSGLPTERTKGVAHKNHLMRAGACRQRLRQCVRQAHARDFRGLHQSRLLPCGHVGHHPELDSTARIREQRHPVGQIALRGFIGVMQGQLYGKQIDSTDPNGLIFVDPHFARGEFPGHGLLSVFSQHTADTRRGMLPQAHLIQLQRRGNGQARGNTHHQGAQRPQTKNVSYQKASYRRFEGPSSYR